ncbi:hypothetical protein RRG08_027561 [Elysia crispata]|uniref:Uncharacterized protein n=1 Tax=Elysia crispata TaxID=231223 RepID=A0AAE1AFD8_9GAST|nr:hypothetical protein RRG08_027561 [Elysia crispata]
MLHWGGEQRSTKQVVCPIKESDPGWCKLLHGNKLRCQPLKERQRAYERASQLFCSKHQTPCENEMSLLTQTMENKPDSSSAGQGDGARHNPKTCPRHSKSFAKDISKMF